MAFVSITLRLVLITIVLRINALSLKKTFDRAHDLPVEQMIDLTLAKFPESSNTDCACLCSSYLQCTSHALASGLCVLMTARQNVRREQGGVDFYIINEVAPTCPQESGTNGGEPFNLSSAYCASYHPITRIRLYYVNDTKYPQGLEVQHGSDVAHTGFLNGPLYECDLMNNEFIQRWEYSVHMFDGEYPVLGCITLITTHKTCGPYGNAYGTMSTLEGYHLLYIAGRRGYGFDRLTLLFDSC